MNGYAPKEDGHLGGSEERFAGFDLWAMSNLRSSDTGVEGTVIWVSAGEFSGVDARHGPRIVVLLGDKIAAEGLKDAVSVRLTTPPEVLGDLPAQVTRQVVEFVEKNRDVLLEHWNGEIDSGEMIRLLVRI
jgi:hypothetical protein